MKILLFWTAAVVLGYVALQQPEAKLSALDRAEATVERLEVSRAERLRGRVNDTCQGTFAVEDDGLRLVFPSEC